MSKTVTPFPNPSPPRAPFTVCPLIYACLGPALCIDAEFPLIFYSQLKIKFFCVMIYKELIVLEDNPTVILVIWYLAFLVAILMSASQLLLSLLGSNVYCVHF